MMMTRLCKSRKSSSLRKNTPTDSTDVTAVSHETGSATKNGSTTASPSPTSHVMDTDISQSTLRTNNQDNIEHSNDKSHWSCDNVTSSSIECNGTSKVLGQCRFRSDTKMKYSLSIKKDQMNPDLYCTPFDDEDSAGSTESTQQSSPREDTENQVHYGKVSSKPATKCVVCATDADGTYFGAHVCLPCKSFFIRCTKLGEPSFTCIANDVCDVTGHNRQKCQYCRYHKCLGVGMVRREKPVAVEPINGQMLCKVCNDLANGIHFGVITCEGCKKFFRRALKEYQGYCCKENGICTMNPRSRNSCRSCRYKKCLDAGMSRKAIRMGRPRKHEKSRGKSSKRLTVPVGSISVPTTEMKDEDDTTMNTEQSNNNTYECVPYTSYKDPMLGTETISKTQMESMFLPPSGLIYISPEEDRNDMLVDTAAISDTMQVDMLSLGTATAQPGGMSDESSMPDSPHSSIDTTHEDSFSSTYSADTAAHLTCLNAPDIRGADLHYVDISGAVQPSSASSTELSIGAMSLHLDTDSEQPVGTRAGLEQTHYTASVGIQKIDSKSEQFADYIQNAFYIPSAMESAAIDADCQMQEDRTMSLSFGSPELVDSVLSALDNTNRPLPSGVTTGYHLLQSSTSILVDNNVVNSTDGWMRQQTVSPADATSTICTSTTTNLNLSSDMCKTVLPPAQTLITL